MKMTWFCALSLTCARLVHAADAGMGTNATPSGGTSTMAASEAGVANTNRSEAVLNQVISLGNKGADSSYDTNQTEKVLRQVTALGGKIKQDNRWIVIRVLNMKENDLILGLSAFVKYSRGKYPSALTGNTMCDELVKFADRSPAQGGVRETEERFKKEFVNAMCGSGFFEKLVREKRDARYYGAKVTVFDTGRVLVRWRLKKNGYRVIFTDLHAEDVTTERLAELEK